MTEVLFAVLCALLVVLVIIGIARLRRQEKTPAPAPQSEMKGLEQQIAADLEQQMFSPWPGSCSGVVDVKGGSTLTPEMIEAAVTKAIRDGLKAHCQPWTLPPGYWYSETRSVPKQKAPARKPRKRKAKK